MGETAELSEASCPPPIRLTPKRRLCWCCVGHLAGVVPSGSIVAQESVINALVAGVIKATGFSKSGFNATHPQGSIGHDAKSSAAPPQ